MKELKEKLSKELKELKEKLGEKLSKELKELKLYLEKQQEFGQVNLYEQREQSQEELKLYLYEQQELGQVNLYLYEQRELKRLELKELLKDLLNRELTETQKPYLKYLEEELRSEELWRREMSLNNLNLCLEALEEKLCLKDLEEKLRELKLELNELKELKLYLDNLQEEKQVMEDQEINQDKNLYEQRQEMVEELSLQLDKLNKQQGLKDMDLSDQRGWLKLNMDKSPSFLLLTGRVDRPLDRKLLMVRQKMSWLDWLYSTEKCLNCLLGQLTEAQLNDNLTWMRKKQYQLEFIKKELGNNDASGPKVIFLVGMLVISLLIAAKFLGNKDAKIDMNDLHKEDDNKVTNDSLNDL